MENKKYYRTSVYYRPKQTAIKEAVDKICFEKQISTSDFIISVLKRNKLIKEKLKKVTN